MATVLERPPTKQEPAEKTMPDEKIVAVHPVNTPSLGQLPQQHTLNDQIAALLLAIGEYGALAHGAVWAALLSLIPHQGKHLEQP